MAVSWENHVGPFHHQQYNLKKKKKHNDIVFYWDMSGNKRDRQTKWKDKRKESWQQQQQQQQPKKKIDVNVRVPAAKANTSRRRSGLGWQTDRQTTHSILYHHSLTLKGGLNELLPDANLKIKKLGTKN